MMSSTRCLKSLVDSIQIKVGSKETAETLELAGSIPFDRSDIVQELLSNIDQIEGWSISLLDGEYSEVPISELDSVCDDFNLVIRKPHVETVYFATKDGFSEGIKSTRLGKTTRMMVLSEFSSFQTKRFLVESWSGIIEPKENLPLSNFENIDPRRGLVRDLTGDQVPEDPFRWILLGDPSEGEIWDIWVTAAYSKLATLIVSEIWSENGNLLVSINGERKRTLKMGQPYKIKDQEYLQLKEVTAWMLVKQDSEARHEVLTRRISNLIPDPFPPNNSWLSYIPKIVKEAFEAARLDHRAYVRSKSAESVKAMADLRKAVGEDVSRIIERANKLTNGFAVGMVALATGLGVRLTLLSAKGSNSVAGAAFCLIILGITWASIFLQHRISSKSLVNDLLHMRRWHRNLHTVLTRSDYTKLALKPLLDSVQLYKQTAKWTLRGMTIASVIFVVAFIALPELMPRKTLIYTVPGEAPSYANQETMSITDKKKTD